MLHLFECAFPSGRELMFLFLHQWWSRFCHTFDWESNSCSEVGEWNGTEDDSSLQGLVRGETGERGIHVAVYRSDMVRFREPHIGSYFPLMTLTGWWMDSGVRRNPFFCDNQRSFSWSSVLAARAFPCALQIFPTRQTTTRDVLGVSLTRSWEQGLCVLCNYMRE